MKIRIFLVMIGVLSLLNLHAQKQGQEKLDSLLQAVSKATNDTMLFRTYISICIYYQLADASRGIEWGKKALDLAVKKKSKRWQAISNDEIGNTYGFLGDFYKSREHHQRALHMAREIGNPDMIAGMENNLGNAYTNLSEYTKALECFYRCLVVSDKKGNEEGSAITYGNIALTYMNLKDPSKAFWYYEKAQRIFENQKDTYYLGITWSNIAVAYQSLQNFPKAMESYQKALDLSRKMDNKYLISQNLLNLGNLYYELDDYGKALECVSQALPISEEIGDTKGAAYCIGTLGLVYTGIATDTTPKEAEWKQIQVVDRHRFLNLAVEYLTKAHGMAQEMGDREFEKEILKGLYEAYTAQQDYKSALEAFTKSKTIEDTLFSLEKQKQIANLEAGREALLKQKEVEVLTEKNSRQKALIFSSLAGVLLLGVIVGIVVVMLRNKRRAHAILQHKDAIIQADLDKARDYIQSLLPQLTHHDSLSTDWIFIPSSKLGGDAFGYHWIDPGHFAFYILDVCGHGVGPALHAVSVMNILNSRTQQALNLKDPAEVVSGLNDIFQYEEHGGLFFSIWYGVYSKRDSRLSYVCAGHPSPVMVRENQQTMELGPASVAVGCVPDINYKSTVVEVGNTSQIFLFSDGVYEFESATGRSLLLKDFYGFLRDNLTAGLPEIHDRLKTDLQATHFPDDYSMMKIGFTSSLTGGVPVDMHKG
ncbi:MAG TPA: tetratricopeptide repeat protein [Bacteroidales bacterium]|nr:tetratricopeptide repeat protein [Bacteroidales bacterium]HSA44670.1 tetratricopeptide repeat protein [Bacteroidales bacterium]